MRHFMRGNDGSQTSKARPWLLGPSINVTPAIVGRAQKYFQTSNVQPHAPFEGTYASRRSLAWLGANDGFLHAFDLGDLTNPGDGAEVIGLLPPNLIANQITLYNTYLDPDPQVSTDTGQNAGFLFDEHTWGVANSLRFADVWFGARRTPTRRSDSSPRGREAASSPRSTSRTPIQAAR